MIQASSGSRIQSWQRLLVLTCLIQFFVVLGLQMTFPYIPLFMQKELGIVRGEEAAFWTGIAGIGSGATMFLTGPLWGYLGDRVGHKKNILRATFVTALVYIPLGLAQNVLQFTVALTFFGLATGTWVANMALLSTVLPRERVPFAIGMLQVAAFVGMTLGPLPGGLIADTLGFRAAYFVASACLAMAGAIALFFLHEPRKAGPAVQAFGWSNLVGVARAKGVAPSLTVVLLATMLPQMILPVIPVYIQSLRESAPASLAGLAFTLQSLTAAISAYTAVWVARRAGLGRMIVLCAIAYSLLYFLLFLSHSVGAVLVMMALIGFLWGGMSVAVNTLIGLVAPRGQQGTTYGFLQSVSAIGFWLGPLMGGTMARAVGMREVFLFSAGTLLAMAPASWLLLKAAPIQSDAAPAEPQLERRRP
ncbi:MAG: MFS transporter [Chloroflexi bacterium]|nr:MFS transporter [Chloroflexota bacterium]